ncbi:MAG: GNAT family N-acetyltransferase [Candidatus Eremiobacteraeota bacterium]|nr:GNAT family N-acetyltransferase [Candidatus Eremiobacteraeota bacterium]
MKLVRLSPKYAQNVASLESEVYAPPFRHGEDTIKSNLAKSEQDKGNLSWGLIDDDKLVGYITAWLDESHVKEYIQEDVVFIDDIVVLPDFRSGLFKLLKAFKKDMNKDSRWGLPVEGIARKNAYELFTRHRELLEKFGYELAYTYEYFDENLKENLIWIRFECAQP